VGKRGRFGFGLLALAGLTLVLMAGRLQEQTGFESDGLDPGELLTATFTDQGLVSSSRAGTMLGGVVLIVGLAGFARSFAEDPTDPNVDSPLSAFDALTQPPPAGAAPSLSAAAYGGADPFDPTTWDHGAAVLWEFRGRSPLAFFDVLQEIRLAAGTTLLVAALQDLEDRDRRLVAVLGTDSAVATFEPTVRQELHRRIAEGLDWERVRPDAQVQKQSYDPTWVLDDDSAYRALRSQLRAARFRVMAAA